MNVQRLSREGVGSNPEIVSTYYFYKLCCPFTNEVKYIGRTVSLSNRLRNHIYEAKKNNRNKRERWIVSLLRKNKEPIMQVIWQGSLTLEEAMALEKYLIKHYRKKFQLKNDNDSALGGSFSTKVVYQFSSDGLFLSSFANANQAMINTGVKDVNITRCCKNENGYGTKQAGGFFWSYINYKEYPHKFVKNWRELKGKAVIATNLTTNEELEFTSARQATKALGVNYKAISSCCNGHKKKAGNYLWRFK
jgi:predicted GIY-YIG superfamily endonuclease